MLRVVVVSEGETKVVHTGTELLAAKAVYNAYESIILYGVYPVQYEYWLESLSPVTQVTLESNENGSDWTTWGTYHKRISS